MKTEVARVEKEPSIPDLFAKMANDVTQLFDAKLALFRIEVREEIETYVRGTVMLIIGTVVALVGFAILNVAIAFFVSTLLESTSLTQPARYGIGFAITALVYLVAGVALIIVSKNRMAEQRLVPPRTVAELQKDKEFVEREI